MKRPKLEPTLAIQSGDTPAPMPNAVFNDFLDISAADLSLLRRYRDALRGGGERFAKIFYDYLFDHPATAKVPGGLPGSRRTHRKPGAEAAATWTTLLEGMLTRTTRATRSASAQVHYRYRIELVWIMGAYLLYLEHLQSLIRTSPEVRGIDYEPPRCRRHETLVPRHGPHARRLLDAATKALHLEQDKVVNLQEQITSLLANIPQMLWSIDVINNRLLYVSPSARASCNLDIDTPVPCLGWTIPEDRETVRLAWQKALAWATRSRSKAAHNSRTASSAGSAASSIRCAIPPGASCASTA